MSLESFIGLDSSEPMSEAAFEALRERMRAAAAQIAAIRKEERKQKKKEDELLKILFQFVKTSQKTDLVLLISRALEKNIPANFILAIILLGNEDIQRELGNFLMLETPLPEQGNEQALIFFNQPDESLPLKVRIEMDTWIKGLLFQAEESPQKLLKTAYIQEVVDENLIRLATFVVRDFLNQKGVSEEYERLHNFSQFVLQGILQKTAENLDNRKMLGHEPL